MGSGDIHKALRCAAWAAEERIVPAYDFKAQDGTYRPPATPEETKLKAEARASGTLRRIKGFLGFLEQGLAVPEEERPTDATLADWIRHCKRSGFYEQGKLLYEKGGLALDHLPEVAQATVEEDYQVCLRALIKGSDASKTRRKKAR
jgi:hypothetical protein